jgi:hypothetical protein
MFFIASEKFDGAKDIFVIEHILCWLALVVVLFVGCIFNIRVKVDFQRVARTKKEEILFEPINATTSEKHEEELAMTQSNKA